MFPISLTSSHLLAWTFSDYNPIYYVFETPYLLSKVLELEPDEVQQNFGPRFSLFLLTLEYYFDEVSVSEFDGYSYDAQDNLALFHVSENADETDPIMSYSSVEATTHQGARQCVPELHAEWDCHRAHGAQHQVAEQLAQR